MNLLHPRSVRKHVISATLGIILLTGLATPWAMSQSHPVPQPPGHQSAVPGTGDAGHLDNLLMRTQQFAQTTANDLSRLKIDKWKTDGSVKDQTRANAESLQRNLQFALPDLITGTRNFPQNLSSNFKLYRNLNAVYDVLASVAESTGAFAGKDQYEPLARDVAELDSLRRAMADRLDWLATANDAELARLRAAQTQVKAATPPTKVVVDDNASAPKTKKKKKPAASVSKPPS